MTRETHSAGLWLWLPILILLGVNLQWQLSDVLAIRLIGWLALPLLTGWLGARYGRKALPLVALVAVTQIPWIAFSPRADLSIGYGESLSVLLMALGPAAIFARRSAGKTARIAPALISIPVLVLLYFALPFAGLLAGHTKVGENPAGIFIDSAALIGLVAFFAVASGRVRLASGLIAGVLFAGVMQFAVPALAQTDTVIVTGTKVAFDPDIGWTRDVSLAIWAVNGALLGGVLAPFFQRVGGQVERSLRTALMLLVILALAFIAPYWTHEGLPLGPGVFSTLPHYLGGEAVVLTVAGASFAAGLAWSSHALLTVPLIVNAFLMAAIALHLGSEALSTERLMDAASSLVEYAIISWIFVWFGASSGVQWAGVVSPPAEGAAT